MNNENIWWIVAGLLLMVLFAGAAISASTVDTESNHYNASSDETTSTIESDTIHDDNTTHVAVMYYDCKYCDNVTKFVTESGEQYENVEVELYNIHEGDKNQSTYDEFTDSHGIIRNGVPAVFIGSEKWFGYTEELEQEVRDKIRDCAENPCESIIQ